MTNNLTNQQKKDWAKLLFMQEGMTFQDIAQNCLPPSPKWRAISASQTLSE